MFNPRNSKEKFENRVLIGNISKLSVGREEFTVRPSKLRSE